MKTLVVKYTGNGYYEAKIVEGLFQVQDQSFYVRLTGNVLHLRTKCINQKLIETIQSLGVEVVTTLA